MAILSGATVLVTGANGFLGRHLVARLRTEKAVVHAVSRSASSPATDEAHWLQGDLTDGAWLQGLVGQIRPDVIYQLTSCSLGGQNSDFVLPTFENDLRCTVNALLAAKACGCKRIVLVASLEEPVHDGTAIRVSSPYAAAKTACTYYGLMFHQLYGVPVTLLRPFMVYGPGQKHYKLIPHTVLSLLKGEPPKLGSGARPVDWVYVQDVITAFIAAAVEPSAVGLTIDLGSGQLVPISEVVQEIHRLIPGSPAPLLGALADRMMETVRCAETGAALRVLNWRASTPLPVGLSETIEWYRAQSVNGDNT
jgi:UDP-glucose 4-epimerase